MFHSMHWFISAFLIVFTALFATWATVISGGPPHDREVLFVKDKVGAAYVISLKRLEVAARNLRAGYCADAPVGVAVATKGEALAACEAFSEAPGVRNPDASLQGRMPDT